MSLLDKFYEWTNYKFRPFSHYWWRDLWYQQISSRLWPRQKWITKKIPRTWVDKDTLLEIVVLESLKHYCAEDGEDCFNVLSCDSPEWQAEFMRQVRHHNELATQKLVALQKELDAEWDSVPHRSLEDIQKGTSKDDYDKMYGKIDRLEKEIYDLQTEIMVWVVKNRNGLWT